MLKDLFSNRLFLGALAFFVLCIGCSLLYMQHVERQTARKLTETQEHIKVLTEKPKPTAEVPEDDTPQGGHFHADGAWHEEPHASVEQLSTAEVSDPTATPDSDPTAPAAETKPLGFITFEEYKQQFTEWEKLPRDEWGIARHPDGSVGLFPKPPAQVGKWRSREEKEKASDLWWALYVRKVEQSRETARLLRERNRQLTRVINQ